MAALLHELPDVPRLVEPQPPRAMLGCDGPDEENDDLERPERAYQPLPDERQATCSPCSFRHSRGYIAAATAAVPVPIRIKVMA